MSPPLDRADTAATLKAPVLTVSHECAFDDLTWWRSICANKLRRRERRFSRWRSWKPPPLSNARTIKSFWISCLAYKLAQQPADL